MENEFNNIDERLLLEDERIAKYLKGKMTADEEQLFMQELDTNAELKEKAVAMARLARAMKSHERNWHSQRQGCRQRVP